MNQRRRDLLAGLATIVAWIIIGGATGFSYRHFGLSLGTILRAPFVDVLLVLLLAVLTIVLFSAAWGYLAQATKD